MKYANFDCDAAYEFVRESNRIEGIRRDPTSEEIEEHKRFMALEHIDTHELKRFVKVYQPNAKLRNKKGLNVRVGDHYPIPGGREVATELARILICANTSIHQKSIASYQVHQEYETLHPFTDGNGRSGRMLWLWMMRTAPLGFLHTWYYQSLSNARE